MLGCALACTGAAVSEQLDRALLPGALVTGSPPRGTGYHMYAVIGENMLPSEPIELGWRSSLCSCPAQPCGTLYPGVLFMGGARSLWRADGG